MTAIIHVNPLFATLVFLLVLLCTVKNARLQNPVPVFKRLVSYLTDPGVTVTGAQM